MPPKIIKLGKKDDIASVVKQLKSLREKEVTFELETGSLMLKNSDTLRLLKRTGDAMGKKVLVDTDDEIGRVLAKKAGVLAGNAEVHMPARPATKVSRSDIKPRFNDISMPRKAIARVAERATQAFSTLPKMTMQPSNVPPAKKKRMSKLTKRLIWITAVVVLILFALAIFLPKATVTVFARSEPVSRDLEITVDESAISSDANKLIIPGLSVTREVSQTKNFPVTGTAASAQKATGSVVIYNQTIYTLTLKAATTTLVVGDKKYSFTKDVAGIKPNGQTGPVPIIAQGTGDAYNLTANQKFQIVNAALGNRNVYAINPAAIATSGDTSPTKILTQADLDAAKDSLTNDIIQQAETDLAKEKGEPIKVLPSGVTKEVLADTANKDLGAATDNFDMTLIARVTGIGFNENDVIDMARAKINQVLSTDKYLINDSTKQSVTMSFKSLDLAHGTGVLAVHYETVAAYQVSENDLANVLAGKNESEIKEILMSKPEVDSVQVAFWPSWLVHKAPRWTHKIYIRTELSQ